jgi:thiamine transport system permease protein
MTRLSPIAVTITLALAAMAGFVPVLALGLTHMPGSLDHYIWTVLNFTLLQAGLSTLLSLCLGVAVALAVVRHHGKGRDILQRLLALPLALPAITAVLGIVQVYGAQGWLGGWVPLYGLSGVLLAHVFFNFPLVARFALAALDSISPENQRLAVQLGMRRSTIFRHLEWPALRQVLPGVALLVFMLCAASFTVVLILGGGPQATTLEVAIYQSLRADFDPARAATLAILQTGLVALMLVASHWVTTPNVAQPGLLQKSMVPHAKPSLLGYATIALALLILAPPLLALIIAGLQGFNPTALLARAVLTSITFAAVAAAVATMLSWSLATWHARSPIGRRIAPAATLAALVMPPAVIATGWFILASRLGVTMDRFLIVALNIMTSLPFCYHALQPATARHVLATDRLCASLGLTGFNRLRRIDWPALRPTLMAGGIMAAMVAIGDLTAILLLGSGGFVTLPTLIYQQMGSYRGSEAAGTALVLVILAFGLLALSDRLGRRT